MMAENWFIATTPICARMAITSPRTALPGQSPVEIVVWVAAKARA